MSSLQQDSMCSPYISTPDTYYYASAHRPPPPPNHLTLQSHGTASQASSAARALAEAHGWGDPVFPPAAVTVVSVGAAWAEGSAPPGPFAMGVGGGAGSPAAGVSETPVSRMLRDGSAIVSTHSNSVFEAAA